MSFQAGFSANASFTPTGGATTALNITSWSWSENVNSLEVTHTGTGGLSAFIAGVLTGDFSFDANFDTAANPFASSPSLKAGKKGVITLNTNTTAPWSIGVMIEKVDHKAAVNGLIQFTVSGKLDVISGSYSYPTVP